LRLLSKVESKNTTNKENRKNKSGELNRLREDHQSTGY
jgi:hypothetical protein